MAHTVHVAVSNFRSRAHQQCGAYLHHDFACKGVTLYGPNLPLLSISIAVSNHNFQVEYLVIGHWPKKYTISILTRPVVKGTREV